MKEESHHKISFNFTSADINVFQRMSIHPSTCAGHNEEQYLLTDHHGRQWCLDCVQKHTKHRDKLNSGDNTASAGTFLWIHSPYPNSTTLATKEQ